MSSRSKTVGAALLLAVFSLPAPRAFAQTARANDYLIGRPRASLNLRIGASRPNASDGVFAAADANGNRLLTLGANQFLGASLGADLGIVVTQRVELQFSVTTAGRRAESEYRDFIGTDDLPIEQASRLRRVPVSAGVRYNLTPAGRAVSRLAWVPTKLVPYVAAGGGAMWYKFTQDGEFIDYQTADLDIFRANLESSGWAAMGYAATGVTWSVRPAVSVNTELRYDHSRAPMQGDFTGFGKTALSGVGLTTGLQFRF